MFLLEIPGKSMKIPSFLPTGWWPSAEVAHRFFATYQPWRRTSRGMGTGFPLVNIQKTMENHHRNREFSHEKCWCSIIMLVCLPEGTWYFVMPRRHDKTWCHQTWLENQPFIVDFPMKSPMYSGFPVAMFAYRLPEGNQPLFFGHCSLDPFGIPSLGHMEPCSRGLTWQWNTMKHHKYII